MLYTDPLVHLIIDFIIDSECKVAESWSFAYLHQIDGKHKPVQKALAQLQNDGILNMIEQKKEHFIADYLGKMNMNETDYKNDAKNKTDVYYFNVDLKFILKARMHLLAEQFENKIKEAQQYGHKYKCYNCVDGDENEYSEV